MSAEQGKIGLLILTHCEVGVGLLESVSSQENSQNGQISQSARWIVSMSDFSINLKRTSDGANSSGIRWNLSSLRRCVLCDITTS